MNFGSTRVNPYLFQSGGRISGDYSYQGTTKIRMTDTADIELAKEEARIQQAGDILNYICFKDNQLWISKNLNVVGTITAGDWPGGGGGGGGGNANDLHVLGTLTVDGGTILQSAFCHGTMQAAVGLFSGAVTALTGAFGTTTSVQSTMGSLTCLTLTCPVGTIGVFNTDTLNVSADIIVHNPGDNAEIFADHITVNQVLTAHDVTVQHVLQADDAQLNRINCYSFRCQNAVPQGQPRTTLYSMEK
jgi:hypothetical protein